MANRPETLRSRSGSPSRLNDSWQGVPPALPDRQPQFFSLSSEYSTSNLLDVCQLRSVIDEVISKNNTQLSCQFHQDALALSVRIDAVYELLVRVEKHVAPGAIDSPSIISGVEPRNGQSPTHLQKGSPGSPSVSGSGSPPQSRSPRRSLTKGTSSAERAKALVSMVWKCPSPTVKKQGTTDELAIQRETLPRGTAGIASNDCSSHWEEKPPKHLSESGDRRFSFSNGDETKFQAVLVPLPKGEPTPLALNEHGFRQTYGDSERAATLQDEDKSVLVRRGSGTNRKPSGMSMSASVPSSPAVQGGLPVRHIPYKSEPISCTHTEPTFAHGGARSSGQKEDDFRQPQAAQTFGQSATGSQEGNGEFAQPSRSETGKVGTETLEAAVKGVNDHLSSGSSSSSSRSSSSSSSSRSSNSSNISPGSSAKAKKGGVTGHSKHSTRQPLPGMPYVSEDSRRVNDDSTAATFGQAKSGEFGRRLSNTSKTSKKEIGPRVSSFHSLDVHNLDAMCTDQLFQACGISQQKVDSGYHDGRQSQAPKERRTSNASNKSVWSSSFSPNDTMPPTTRVATDLSRAGEEETSAAGSNVKMVRSLQSSITARSRFTETPSQILPTALDKFVRKPSNQSPGAGGSSNQSPDYESGGGFLGRNTSRALALTDSWVSSMDALREEHEKSLVKISSQLFSSNESDELRDVFDDMPLPVSWLPAAVLNAPRFLMCLYGVLPFQVGNLAFWYTNIVQISVAFLLAYSFMLAVVETESLYIHLTTVCYALGCLMGVLFLRMRRIHDLLGPHDRQLELYARNFEFFEEWQEVSVRRFFIVLALWTCTVLSRVFVLAGSSCPAAMGGTEDRDMAWPPLISFVVISGMLSVLAYCQLHVCCGLEMAVDKYCHRFYMQKRLGVGICEWNVLQAMLRRSATTIDSCFLAQSTSVLATVLLTGVEVIQSLSDDAEAPGGQCFSLWCGWVIPPIMLMIYTTFRAAAVTEKCCRVPALVNSWPFKDDRWIDYGRQYAVEYITNSAAGFYVKGVRLSAFMAFKLTYLFGVVMFTLITQAILRS